ncbi:MAG: hypothetical protein IJB34_04920 [Clostridia bacterium]|nr:hypothetical protein [Clostridia bacterium]
MWIKKECGEGNGEKTTLKALASLEDLAEKKIMIFSRLLTDASLAQKMQSLATRHERRKTALLSLCGEKKPSKSEEGEA